jgi:hypothetical protein
MQTDAPLRKTAGRLSREDQRRLGDILQRAYDDVIRQGVPDRFRDLLDKLDSGEGGRGGAALSHELSGHNEEAYQRADDEQNSDPDRLMEAKSLHTPGTKGSN